MALVAGRRARDGSCGKRCLGVTGCRGGAAVAGGRPSPRPQLSPPSLAPRAATPSPPRRRPTVLSMAVAQLVLMPATLLGAANAWSDFSFLFADASAAAQASAAAAAMGTRAAAGAGAGLPPPPAAALLNVQLQKQYVPVASGGKTIAYKTAYFGSIYLGGHASQLFTVVFDTGSGHLILPSTACTSETCMQHRRYNRTLSDTAMDIEYDGTPINLDTVSERDQVSIAFGTGEVTGVFVHEKACLSRRSSDWKAVNANSCADLRVVIATHMTDDPFSFFTFDGVLGLGLSALTLDKSFSFFPQLVGQHPELRPQFAVFLSPFDGGDSVISFGGHEPSRAASEISWAPVAKPELGYWQVQIKSLRIGNTVLDECSDGTCHAIFDTGTSLLGVPRQASRSMHRLLARPVPAEIGQDSEQVDCRTLPGRQIHFDLGGPVLSLGVEDYSRPTPFSLSVPAKNEGGVGAGGESAGSTPRLFCRSLLLPVDMGPPVGPKVFIFGEPVLRRYYTIYDFGERRIGFARAAELPEGSRGLPALGAPPAGSTVSGAPLPPPSALRGRGRGAALTRAAVEVPAGGASGPTISV